MLPNVLQPNATDHVPVLAEEVRDAPRRRSPGETVVDATFGAGGHASLLAADLQGEGASSRSTATRPCGRTSRASGATRASSRASCAARRRSCSTSWPRTACRPTRSCSTSASRACRSTGPSAASRTRPTRRSTCAWTRPRSVSAADLVNEASERELITIFRRYGEERYAKQIARAIGRRRARSAVRAHRRARRDRSTPRFPAPARFGEGHPGQARLPGAADRRQRRARRARGGAAGRASRCCGRAAGSP